MLTVIFKKQFMTYDGKLSTGAIDVLKICNLLDPPNLNLKNTYERFRFA